MNALDFFNPTPAERAWLRLELLRRAAQEYELAHNWPNAADCWAQAGEPNRAADLYLALDQPVLAAPQLLAAKRYAEATPCYRTWLATVEASDVLARIQAHLGLAASLLCAAQASGWQSELNQAEEASAPDYQAARQLLQAEPGAPRARPALLAGQCWEALGAYGVTINRPDLAQQGYELALARYGDEHPSERLRAARAYRKAIEWNQLLTADLDERLAHWREPAGRAAQQPAWLKLRDEIERLGFRDGVHDVLHFADEDHQLAAWQKLAVLDHDPHQAAIDEYLRTLAPENMVYIPAGQFLMGSADDDPNAQANEKPQHEVELGGYYIGRYPVTNAEYAAFIQAGGYQNRTYWTEVGWAQKGQEGWSEPRLWNNAQFNGPQQPVVGVSWYEAVAYCTWRNGRLPTEAEWEKAAGWDEVAQHKRRYPWGDAWEPERCQANQGPNGHTSPIGHYSPQGDSATGVSDLAGNVWEWCSSRWGANFTNPDYGYPYAAADGREDNIGGNTMLRIQRGGSWYGNNSQLLVRCAYRDRYCPRDWVNYRGFRYVAPRCLLSF